MKNFESYFSLIKFGALFSLFALIQGCSGGPETGQSSSGVIRTENLYAVYSVYDDDSGTYATAKFYEVRTDNSGSASIGANIEIEESDQILVEIGSELRALQLNANATDIEYRADFVAGAAGTTVDFRLTRTADVDAFSSNITLKPDFSITAPAPNTSFNKDDFVNLTWNPDPEVDDEEAFFFASVSCDDGSSSDFSRTTSTDEQGALSFISSNIFSELAFTSTCTALLSIVKRGEEDAIDPAFSGGEVIGDVIRSVTITITP